ncbi:MAG TPA: mannose-1-phosphate guanylyltransferase [Prolixibacteraceae bacterium]|nr:mannose-1-phosphate guanylyltransferase [Prolixibacteraceae bacterium]
MSKKYCLIMAGGSGTRFWPRSRVLKPKQYLSLFGDRSLIQESVQRFSNFIAEDCIYVVSAKSQQSVLEEQTTNLPKDNLIFEPVGKNTLPAIGLAALFIAEKDPEGILIVSPSDHLIQNDTLFRQTIESAAQIAEEKEGIVTIGITPKYPATGYGYVKTAEEVKIGQSIKSFAVNKFVEKPNLEVATGYLKSSGFFWNSGIFVFKVSVFLDSVQKYAPKLYADLLRIKEYIGTDGYEEALDRIYNEVESISIDYGILEKADNVFLVQGDFVWNDLGSWEEVYKYDTKDENGNATTGESILLDTNNSYVYAPNSLVAIVGLDDVIVVQEGDTILVCKRDRAEEIKQVVGEITKRKLDQYL